MAPKADVDIVFVQDLTGSQGPYITAVKEKMKSTVQTMKSDNKITTLRMGLITFRDYADNASADIVTHDFTTDIDVFNGWLNPESATGGGDGPEAQTRALYALLTNVTWQAQTRIAVLITDSPPHGVDNKAHDDYPKGDPNTPPLSALAGRLRDANIHLFIFACEPTLSSYYNLAYSFYIDLLVKTNNAQVTSKTYQTIFPSSTTGTLSTRPYSGLYGVTTNSSDLMSTYVHHAVSHAIAINSLVDDHKDWIVEKAVNSSHEEVADALHVKLESEGVKIPHLDMDPVYDHNDDFKNHLSVWSAATSIEDAKSKLGTGNVSFLKPQYHSGTETVGTKLVQDKVMPHQAHQIVATAMARDARERPSSEIEDLMPF